MPFAVCAMPPIGLGLLKARLETEGVATQVYDFNLQLLPLIDNDLAVAGAIHDEIAYLWDFMPGEWLFSPSRSAAKDTAYLLRLQNEAGVRPELLWHLARLREQSEAFVDSCVEELLLGDHDILGVTSSFMQTQPSIALAKRFKTLRPSTSVVFGGSNAFGVMGAEVLRQFECVDVVVHGEADDLVADLVRTLRGVEGYRLANLRGISYRAKGVIIDQSSGATMPNVETLPVPDYMDYFARLHRLEASYGDSGLPHFVPFETARGCWWGAKSHCTFCGLNADRMTFRSKSPDAALELIRELRRRHGLDRFFAVDNIIDHRYYETLLDRLAKEPGSLLVHYEIKSNLTRHQVEKLARAGVRKVQPGIESLSTSALKRMRKGVSAIQNVMALKWLTEYDMQVTWFILYGFPGEDAEPYYEMARLIPKLVHLVPPRELAPVYLERFSPYHAQPASFGIRLTGPASWYHDAFPQVPPSALEGLAYRFDYEEPDRDPQINRFVETELRPIMNAWQNTYAKHGSTLSLVHGPDDLTAVVSGPLESPTRVTLVDGTVSRIMRMTDDISGRDRIKRTLSASCRDDKREVGGRSFDPLPPRAFEAFILTHRGVVVDQRGQEPDSTDETIDRLEEQGLLMVEGTRILALPVDVTRTVHRIGQAGEQRSRNVALV
jgi:ribosomal peptide maturation radical SAM protein 1